MLYHNFVIITGESSYKELLICYNVLRIHLPNKQSKVSGKYYIHKEKGGLDLDHFRM